MEIIDFLQQNNPLAGMPKMLSLVLHRAVLSDLKEEGGFCLYLKLSQAGLRARGMEKS